MKVDQVLHMVGGAGETSYAKNSRLQEKVILWTKPIVEEAIHEICNTLHINNFVVADLGCSSGPNIFLVISQIINAIEKHYCQLHHNRPEIQYFLNDLPNNDFNNIFQLLMLYEKHLKDTKGAEYEPFYVVGLPGSFYGRLFPSISVHFFHSSYCLMWLSQFKRDFSEFLRSRSKELVFGGKMVLTFLGRKNSPSIGDLFHLWGLLADALNSMVSEGLVEEAKLNAFNLPFYAPLMEEVKSIIEMEGSFHLEQAQTLESNWDPFDDSIDNLVIDSTLSGQNVAKYIRAVLEPILVCHFGDNIIEDLFLRYAKNIAKHVSMGKAKFVNLILTLKLK